MSSPCLRLAAILLSLSLTLLTGVRAEANSPGAGAVEAATETDALPEADALDEAILTAGHPPLVMPRAAMNWMAGLWAPGLLDEVRWTVEREETPPSLARAWGTTVEQLLLLNPGLGRRDALLPGQRLVIYRAGDVERARSHGSPNRRGRLKGGVPLPENPAWYLRKPRDRVYGTRLSVSAIIQASERLAAAHPSSPPVVIGDLSRRRGGSLTPHRSHRSGRDADISFIQQPAVPMWSNMNDRRIDAEKTWYFIYQLIATGAVLHVYMDRGLQETLYHVAAKTLPQEELDRLFQFPRRKRLNRKPTVLRHWKGHRNHMHVRFKCGAWNRRCRGPALRR